MAELLFSYTWRHLSKKKSKIVPILVIAKNKKAPPFKEKLAV